MVSSIRVVLFTQWQGVPMKRIQTILPPPLAARLKKAMEKTGQKESELVRMALMSFLRGLGV